MADEYSCSFTEIQRLHEEWDHQVRAELLEQFESEIASWAQYRVPSRHDNNDLFTDVQVSTNLDISPPRVTSATPRRRKSKNKESKMIKRMVRKSKNPRKRKTKNTNVLEACEVEFPKVSTSTHGRLSDSQINRNKQKNKQLQNNEDMKNLRPGAQTDNKPPVSLLNEGQASSNNHGNKLPNLATKDKEEESGHALNIQQLMVPIVQNSPSAAQVAMLIVQTLAWDTVRMVRRSGYSEGFSIVLVKPKGMHEAPTLLAMQNSKGDLTIPCDSLSNQRALFRIIEMLGDKTNNVCT
ncbi:uncharacterized protein [Apostichopus japonicus]|uniref:uncharacterized protein n=1 Tax=Stichopus japonicus TaxID=307972 RepID=UPI003AB41C25